MKKVLGASLTFELAFYWHLFCWSTHSSIYLSYKMSFKVSSIRFENSDSDEISSNGSSCKKASTRHSRFSQISFPDTFPSEAASDVSVDGDTISITKKWVTQLIQYIN